MEQMGLLFTNQKEVIERQLVKLQSNITGWMFGYRIHPIKNTPQLHNGVDLPNEERTPIYAPWNGVVRAAWLDTTYGGGNSVVLTHVPAYCGTDFTGYAHMYQWASGLVAGCTVHKGEVIGYVGTTGVSTGPHLHFTMRKKVPPNEQANTVDPLPELCAACGVVELPPVHEVG